MNVEVVKSCNNLLTQAKKTYVKPVCESIGSNEFLQKIHLRSQQIYTELSHSVKSKTLQELYTDEFRPTTIKSGKTTVKSLLTGKPIEAGVAGELLEGFSPKSTHQIRYNIYSKDGILGYKRFGIYNPLKKDKNFITGYIESFCNDVIAGTQIRLLQATIENASKLGINRIPLQSLIPAVIHHTKMGFRPIESYTAKILSIEDIPKLINKYKKIFKRFNFNQDEITPIISVKNGEYYFDLNKTLYCSAMKHNKNLLNLTKQRNIAVNSDTNYGTIDMVLEGKEYNDWLKRIKGFEITADGDVPMIKENFLHKIQRYIIATLRS